MPSFFSGVFGLSGRSVGVSSNRVLSSLMASPDRFRLECCAVTEGGLESWVFVLRRGDKRKELADNESLSLFDGVLVSRCIPDGLSFLKGVGSQLECTNKVFWLFPNHPEQIH